MYSDKQIEAWVRNTKHVLPLIGKEIEKLQKCLPTDEEIEKIHEWRNQLFNMKKTLREIEEQLPAK